MLTSRARIRNLLAGLPVDRIPNGLGGAETAGLHLLAYERLKKILGVDDPRNRMTTFMTNALVELAVLEAMEGDVILLSSRMCPSRFWGPGSEREWKEERFWGRRVQVAREWNFRHEADGTIWWENIGWKCPPGGIYFDPVPAALDLGRLDAVPDPDDYQPSHDLPDEMLRGMQEAARWLYENTPYSIACGETITDLQLRPGGREAWWMLLLEAPQVAHEFLGKACEAGLSQLKLVDQAVGRYADQLLIADDIGDVRGVTIGPDLWREVYKPHYRRLLSGWHEITSMKVHLHCCGSIPDILGDLIECGVDVLNPVQVSARGMEPGALKTAFGERIVFCGGCFDAVQTPPHTPEEVVYRTVARNIRALSRGGGYLFAGVHNIPGDTPEAHLRAMLHAYRDCRDLPELRSHRS